VVIHVPILPMRREQTCKTVSAETHGSTNQGVVQELLYHSAIAITLDTYSHVLPGMEDHTARAMQDALTPLRGCTYLLAALVYRWCTEGRKALPGLFLPRRVLPANQRFFMIGRCWI
jgi:hypothetical protein